MSQANQVILTNADNGEMELKVPEGHKHLRATIRLQDGREIILQEATIANLVRAYVTVKTHPQKESVLMSGQQLTDDNRKVEFAEWQLLE